MKAELHRFHFVKFAGQLLVLLAIAAGSKGLSASDESLKAGRRRFEASCALCHGGNAQGGDRGPSLLTSKRQVRTEDQVKEVVRNGMPEGGMPAFNFSEQTLQQVVDYLRSLNSPASESPTEGDVTNGKSFFLGEGQCLSCHTLHGQVGLTGPDLTNLADRRKRTEIEEAVKAPSATILDGYQAASVRLRDGRILKGFVKNRSSYDLQVQSFTGEIHLLRQSDVSKIEVQQKSLMPPISTDAKQIRDLLAFLTRLSARHLSRESTELTSTFKNQRSLEKLPGYVPFSQIVDPKPENWTSYHGHLSGNRHSTLRQINRSNVDKLAVKWMYPMPDSRGLQVTPVVIDGIMYVTTANACHALDAATGRAIWTYSRPRTEGLVGDPSRGLVRGVSLVGDKIFMLTDNAHLLALHRVTGHLLWEADLVGDLAHGEHYGSTSAPLVVGDLVIAGISGGDAGIRGFLDAYRISDGKRIWRFWTVPRPGEPLSETWVGQALQYGCGSTWLTGSYDPEENLLFWTTGNPCPDFNGEERRGDNLYSDSILALKPETGKLVWYYQYTPHDVWDYDAQQPPLLIDAEFQGKQRKLLAQANRNGFFYVFDRTDGELLVAEPYVNLLTWATEIGPDGRPDVVKEAVPAFEGTKVCPSPIGATNWMSTSYSPRTKLFYVSALEECAIVTKSARWFKHGEQFLGGYWSRVPGEPGTKYVRAIDIETGDRVWEYRQGGPGTTLAGVLSTDGGVVFFGDDGGAFAAVDANTGDPLWHLNLNHSWRASPMTYMADGKQFISIAMGSYVAAFGLP